MALECRVGLRLGLGLRALGEQKSMCSGREKSSLSEGPRELTNPNN